MKQIGYARVSTNGQSLAIQAEELKNAGCTKIYQDKASGKNTQRPQFEEMMAAINDGLIGKGDAIVITKLDRMGRNTSDLLQIVEQLNEANVALRILDFMGDSVDTSSPQGKMMLTFFAGIAEYERALIVERTEKGRQAAKARGRVGGRPRTIDQQKVQAVLKLAETMTTAEACKQVGISRATFYRLNK